MARSTNVLIKRLELDLKKLGAELVAVGKSLLEEHPDVTCIVLECTDLPPYAHQLQSALKRPVADITTLATMV